LGLIREELNVDNLFRQCSIIHKKQANSQPLSREEESLLAYYSERVFKGSDGATLHLVI